jgi:alpha-1,2-mannosyltransferase
VVTSSHSRARHNRAVYLTIGAFAVTGLLLRLYQLSRPGALLGVTQYDDGVLFGNAVRLAGGVLPYRDFVMVQPPGSLLLMAPVALVAKATGTAWGLALARILTVCADTACIVLLGLLVRHRGRLAIAIACGIYTVYPGALEASSTFLLEPWLNLFCLGAALLIFNGDRFAASWRLAAGGVLFGFAVAIKLWAAVPLLVAGLLLAGLLPAGLVPADLLSAGRARRLGLLAAGAIAGLAVPVLPFLFLAPGQLISQVITSQFLRSTLPHPLSPRLADMAGLSLLPGLPKMTGIIILLAIAAYLVAGYLVMGVATRRPPPALDRYALASLAAVIVMFLLPSEYYSHYAAFAGPFAALALALPAGLYRQAESRNEPGQMIRLAALAVSGAAVATLIATAGIRQATAEPQLLEPPGTVAAVDRLIPAGSCVITNNPALTIVANRFVAARPGCPPIVDTYGTLLTMTDGRPQTATIATMRAAELTWQGWLEQAPYVWLDPADHGLPWINSLYNYLGANFRRVQLADDDPAPRGGLFLRTSTAVSHRHSRRAGGARRSRRYR